MEIKIPGKFKLFAQTILVELKADLMVNENLAVGVACYGLNKIKLQSSCEGIKKTQEQIELNFFHELTHYIINTGDLRNDIPKERLETFVEIFSNLLHQAVKTAEG